MSHSQVDNHSPYKEFIAGAKAILPLIIGAIPFGIIFGTLAQSSGLSPGGAIAMSALVFAGSAQFITVGLLSVGTAFPIIILTTFVVNLRHLLYSLSLVPHVQNLSPIWKLIFGFWLTDETFAVVISRYNQNDSSGYKHWYYLGAAIFMYINWQICTVIGLTLGHLIPNATNYGLDFAMSVTFIGMIMPYLKNKPMVATVIVSGIMALLTQNLPHQLSLIVAPLAGITAGMVANKINK